MDIRALLAFSVENNASDLHLSTGLAPMLRVDGSLQQTSLPRLDAKNIIAILQHILQDTAQPVTLLSERWTVEALNTALEIDFSFHLPNVARFRVHAFMENRGPAVVFRIISENIPTITQLGLPLGVQKIAERPHGLVLVTGPAGSGKSSTLAAMLDYVNHHYFKHIVTIEDPIEFIHPNKQCLIHQRAVHRDTSSFNSALHAALREDPDIIMIGELRDAESIRLAMTAAETGHLVLATLHTSSASSTIHRMINMFPGEEKNSIRSMLSDTLQAVISQTLLTKIGGGRVAALEVMLCTVAIRNLIREDKVAQLYSVLQTGVAQGMHTLDQHLNTLIKDAMITKETAQRVANNPSLFL
ncbi:MAG: type IV pilus twitching motility protein PilT [Legionellaceae bacterium]|nr:type IV pilus twitching motility protein PilT [Legionellaceae bacterium]